jgi:glycine/D-amino acid oxidase-like deaminating enzyme
MAVDVVIIGGGMAGLNSAYFLKRQGFKVAVIEANKIASGTSGNTTAKITSLHELKYNYLKKTFGKANAQIYADSNEWAIRELEEIVREEGIDCDFVRASAFTYTRNEKEIEKIKEEVTVAKELGLPASFVSEIPSVPFKITGAIKFDNQAYFHPRKYLLKIAELINGGGSYIFENTRALSFEEKADNCEVATDKFNLSAKFVIMATNFPFYDPHLIFSKVPKTISYALASKINNPYPKGEFIGTKNKDLSFRPHQDQKNKWLIIGGKHENTDMNKDIEENFEELEKLALENFKIKSIDFKWGAQDTMSLDKIPYIGQMPNAKRIFVTTGFSAWGMTTSIFSAKILTDLIIGKNNNWKDLYDPSRLRR